jgi:DNA-directed RNA polymerase subunit RPC12/RpoP
MNEDFDDEIECPHCGAKFHYELTRCPNCGVNIYFPDEEEEGEFSKAFSRFIDSSRFPLGILAGWAATIVLSLGLYIPIRFAFTAPQSGYVVYALVVACISVGSFAGGFFAVRVARKYVIVSALLIGLVGVGVAIMILLREWKSVLPFPSVTLGWIVILGASFGGARIAEKVLQKVTFQSLFVVLPTEENLYQDLFIKVGYDHDIAKRLIEYERQRAPGATRSKLIRNAIQRWERDNRTGPSLN